MRVTHPSSAFRRLSDIATNQASSNSDLYDAKGALGELTGGRFTPPVSARPPFFQQARKGDFDENGGSLERRPVKEFMV
jgi:hypothetical protein